MFYSKTAPVLTLLLPTVLLHVSAQQYGNPAPYSNSPPAYEAEPVPVPASTPNIYNSHPVLSNPPAFTSMPLVPVSTPNVPILSNPPAFTSMPLDPASTPNIYRPQPVQSSPPAFGPGPYIPASAPNGGHSDNYHSNGYHSNDHYSNGYHSNDHYSNGYHSNDHYSNGYQSNDHHSNDYDQNNYHSNDYHQNNYHQKNYYPNNDRSGPMPSNPPAYGHGHDVPHTTSGPLACPTTLTYHPPVNCNGCTITEYGCTETASVDCGGCSTLVTSTTQYAFAGLCPVCTDGFPLPTTYAADMTTTVTSCEPTPLLPSK